MFDRFVEHSQRKDSITVLTFWESKEMKVIILCYEQKWYIMLLY